MLPFLSKFIYQKKNVLKVLSKLKKSFSVLLEKLKSLHLKCNLMNILIIITAARIWSSSTSRFEHLKCKKKSHENFLQLKANCNLPLPTWSEIVIIISVNIFFLFIHSLNIWTDKSHSFHLFGEVYSVSHPLSNVYVTAKCLFFVWCKMHFSCLS